MNSADFAASIPGFYSKTAVDQLLVLAWFAETHQEKSTFDAAHIRRLFLEVGAEAPQLGKYLDRLAAKKPPQLLKSKEGFRLAGPSRRAFDTRFGGNPTTTAVSKALTDLPAQVPNVAEREYLAETLNCYRVQAYRATVTMAWNLAFDHFVRWVLEDDLRLEKLNTGIATRYPRMKLVVKTVEDVSEMKEAEFIEAARTGKILDKNTAQILKEKLARRNMAAHPSGVAITQHSADDMITDLVHNVILKMV